LFGLLDVDQINFDDELGNIAYGQLRMIRNEGQRNGRATYVAHVQAVWSNHSLNDPERVCVVVCSVSWRQGKTSHAQGDLGNVDRLRILSMFFAQGKPSVLMVVCVFACC